MTKLLTAASVLAIAGAASAAQFQFLSIQAGGGVPGILGEGFRPSPGATFFQDAFGGNVADAVNPAFIGLAPSVEFDTYASISAIGPVVNGAGSMVSRSFYGDLPAGDVNNAGGTLTVGPGSQFTTAVMNYGLGVSPQPFLSGKAPNQGGGRSDLDGVFLGRYTVTNGGTLQGGGLMAIKDQGDPATYTGNVTIGGGPVQLGASPYELTPFLVTSNAQGNVYDLWLVQIPTPGALALFGLGGVAAIRRRRA